MRHCNSHRAFSWLRLGKEEEMAQNKSLGKTIVVMGIETGTTELIPFTTLVPTWISNNSGWEVHVLSVGNKEKKPQVFSAKRIVWYSFIWCALYWTNQQKSILQSRMKNVTEQEMFTMSLILGRSSKLVCSTGNGDKAGQSLVFNLDLGWRSCKGCSLSLDWVGIAPALFLSEEWHSERFHRACSQEGKALQRGLRVMWAMSHGCEMCRLLCPEHPAPWSQRQESRSQGGEPRTFPSICCAHLHPSLGWLGRGHDFPRSIWDSCKRCFTTKALHHRELWTQKNKKIRVCHFLVHHPEKKTLNLGFVLEM